MAPRFAPSPRPARGVQTPCPPSGLFIPSDWRQCGAAGEAGRRGAGAAHERDHLQAQDRAADAREPVRRGAVHRVHARARPVHGLLPQPAAAPPHPRPGCEPAREPGRRGGGAGLARLPCSRGRGKGVPVAGGARAHLVQRRALHAQENSRVRGPAPGRSRRQSRRRTLVRWGGAKRAKQPRAATAPPVSPPAPGAELLERAKPGARS
mmetsp:Transcript_41238/g.92857  ORF Transcript_41238/g.92857 Transcript_41238/m.92857 type:complete len:208 (-) Transcript_41238:1401-2024(-)